MRRNPSSLFSPLATPTRFLLLMLICYASSQHEDVAMIMEVLVVTFAKVSTIWVFPSTDLILTHESSLRKVTNSQKTSLSLYLHMDSDPR